MRMKFITFQYRESFAGYLSEKLESLSQNTMLCSMDVKAMLKHIELRQEAKVFDCGIAAYLLNPLKSTYTYEELARDYLDGKAIPAKRKTSWQISLKKAAEQDMPELEQLACYITYRIFVRGRWKRS